MSTAPLLPVGATVNLTTRAQSFLYTNWRGETSTRWIVPKKLWFGSTEWHPEEQWFLTAWDTEKKADRDFALAGFYGSGLEAARSTLNGDKP